MARSTFASQNVHKTAFPDHFFKFRCWNIARGCGAKHICKSNCTKHHSFRPILEIQMSKHCTRLWCEVHLQVKMHKAPHSRTTFSSLDVETLHAAVVRRAFASQTAQNTAASDQFWKFGCRKMARGCGATFASQNVQNTAALEVLMSRGSGIVFKSKCTKHLSSGAIFGVSMSKNDTPLWREAAFASQTLKN